MNQLMIDTIAFAQAALPSDEERSGYVVKGETKLMGFRGIVGYGAAAPVV